MVDLSGAQSRSRPDDELLNNQTSRRLTSGQDFTWPLAPGLHGEAVDLRQTPDNAGYLDHATTLMDPNRDLEWATALEREEGTAARLYIQAGGISVAAVLGQLSSHRKIRSWYGIRHAAV